MKKIFVAGFLAMTAISQASITVFLDSTAPSGTNTAFNYSIEQTIGDVLRTGDGFTLYDVHGFVSASAPVDFTYSVQNIGLNAMTPVGVVAPAVDSPGGPNVTFTLTGADTSVMSISGFQIVSTLSGSGGLLAFTGQNAKDRDLQLSNGSLGAVPGPGEVPEPGTWVMLASGLGAVALGRLRRYVQ